MSSGKVRVKINVSGVIFETHLKTLEKFPETLLGNFVKREPYFCKESHDYFFNRNRHAFEAILYFYQSGGDLRLPSTVKMSHFVNDCKFYQIPRFYIENMKIKAGILENQLDRKEIATSGIVTYEKDPNGMCAKIWNFMENPETSKPAEIFAIFSLVLILISVAVICIETELRYLEDDKSLYDLTRIEIVLNSWFLFEVTTRFLFAPKKFKFLTSFLNIVDIVGVVPFFINMALDDGTSQQFSFIRMFRFLRVFRLFRLSKHSTRIKAVGHILKDSVQDLYIFLLCLFIMTVFSGAILYFAETSDPNTDFVSIPQGLWWALQTVVTLGYGDIVPVTWFGKLYASFFMIFGAVTIAIPVLSIVMKFSVLYSLTQND